MRVKLLWGAMAPMLLLATSCADDLGGSRDLRLAQMQVFNPVTTERLAGNAGMFVGINKFSRDNGLPEPSYALHDAIALAYLLVEELRLIPPQRCYLLLSGELSAEAVREHLEQLRTKGVDKGAAAAAGGVQGNCSSDNRRLSRSA